MNDEQRSLEDQAGRFLSERHPIAFARTAARWADPEQQRLWRDMAALGWFGVRLSEAAGGIGLGMEEVCILTELAGRHLLTLPLASSLVIVPWLAAADAGRLLAGEIAIAVDQCGSPWLTYAGQCSHRCRLDQPAGGLQEEPARDASPGLDPTIRIASTALPPDTIPSVARVGVAAGPVGPAALAWSIALASEAIGSADAALRLACGWARERVQFGRPIGANQGLKHPLADAWMALDDARLAVRHAARSVDRDLGSAASDGAAAILATVRGAPRAVSVAMQAHGAIGFTWEHDVHLHLKRVTRLVAELGGENAAFERWEAFGLDT